MSTSVVLPAPELPVIAKWVPGVTFKFISCKTNFLLTLYENSKLMALTEELNPA